MTKPTKWHVRQRRHVSSWAYEPGHEKMCLMSYANNKGADQPAHPPSLISAFVFRCLDSIISLDSIAEISKLKLASVAAQAGLCLTWSETPKDTFCRVLAQIYACRTPGGQLFPRNCKWASSLPPKLSNTNRRANKTNNNNAKPQLRL